MQTLLALKQHELPVNEALVLLWILKHPGAKQSEWSEAFNMGSTVSSPVVRRLVAKKLVKEETAKRVEAGAAFKTYTATARGKSIADTLHSPVNYMSDVKDFHEKFGLAYNDSPRFLPKELSDLSIHCLKEEVKEYEDAVNEGDLEGQFDALIDLVYFALGRAYLHGFPFTLGWERVHGKNMEKRRAAKSSEGKRGSMLDVVKPEGWTPPVLTDLVRPQPSKQ